MPSCEFLSTSQGSVSSDSQALPVAAAAGIPAPPFEAVRPFLREGIEKSCSYAEADDHGGLSDDGTLTEADLRPFSSSMTGFTVYRLVALPGKYVRSKMVVKHYPGVPPIGPLPLPQTEEGTEVVVCPQISRAEMANLHRHAEPQVRITRDRLRSR